jgi:hypothetical protein
MSTTQEAITDIPINFEEWDSVESMEMSSKDHTALYHIHCPKQKKVWFIKFGDGEYLIYTQAGSLIVGPGKTIQVAPGDAAMLVLKRLVECLAEMPMQEVKG